MKFQKYNSDINNMQKINHNYNQEQAEILGLRALTFIASNEDYLTAFLRVTGITLETLQNQASNPEILGNILDYFLQNEKKLLEFCQDEEIDPNDIVTARKSLPGSHNIQYTT